MVDIGKLPGPIKKFRDIVECDLRRAGRLILRIQDEIDPQFRIATPDGDFHLAVTLSPDPKSCERMLRRIKTLMVWKQVYAFTMASELYEPDAVCCLGVSKTEKHLGVMRVTRTAKPWSQNIFWPLEWFDGSQIGDEVIAMLPQKPTALSPKEVSMCQKWFGPNGRYPLVHIEAGELRDV